MREGKDGAKKRGARGSVKNNARLDDFKGGRKKGSADWGGCDERRIQAVIRGITSLGGAVTFGLSRDEGAHSLTLLLDEDRTTMWYNGDADLNTCLDEVIARLDVLD